MYWNHTDNSANITVPETMEESAEMVKAAIKDVAYDILVAVTHLSMREDKRLTVLVPEIDLVLGGHENANQMATMIQPNGRVSVIAKADSNARTAYKHTLEFDKTTKEVKCSSDLLLIDDRFPRALRLLD